jgi:MFS family permease
MFIAGLVIGPIVGMLLGILVQRSTALCGWRGFIAAAILVAVVIAVPVIDIELRLGLAAGLILGSLLWLTPSDFGGDATAADTLSQP